MPRPDASRASQVWPRWRLEINAVSCKHGARGDACKVNASATWLSAAGWAAATARGHSKRIPEEDETRDATARRPTEPEGWIHPNAPGQPIRDGGPGFKLDVLVSGGAFETTFAPDLLHRLWDVDPLSAMSYDAALRFEAVKANGYDLEMLTLRAARTGALEPATLDVFTRSPASVCVSLPAPLQRTTARVLRSSSRARAPSTGL